MTLGGVDPSKLFPIECKIKEVAKPIKPEINDEFAQSLGAENLESCARW